jgi:hypothetical protein
MQSLAPRLPPSRILGLSKFHPFLILVICLMLKYDRFLAKFGVRDFCPRISASPIVSNLLLIMSDIREVPFFSTYSLFRMSAYHGDTLHLVRALCGLKINAKIMHLILKRILSKIASDPMVVSCFERCTHAFLNYSMYVPHQSPICFEISDEKIKYNAESIWEIFSLLKTLPDPKAILDISSAGMSPNQIETYDKLIMMVIFRELFLKRNKVLILLCRYFQLENEYKKQRRVTKLRALRQRTEQSLQLQTGSHDFEVYCYYLSYLSSRVLQHCEQTQSLIDESIKILEIFFQMMKGTKRTYQRGRGCCCLCYHGVFISEFFWNLHFLKEENEKELLEMLKVDMRPRTPTMSPLSFCLHPKFVSSSYKNIFVVLHEANFLNVSPNLIKYFEHLIYQMKNYIISQNSIYQNSSHMFKMKNKFARLMLLVFKFATWLQSDHPHRDFILDCVSFMKETFTTKHPDLEIFLDLQKFQSQKLMGFYDLFKDFQNFAHPSMKCSDPTERTLLCLFDIMHRVFSNKRFLRIIQEFLKTFEKEKNSSEAEFSRSIFKNTYPERTEWPAWIHSFLLKLTRNREYHRMIKGIGYFRNTSCLHCQKFLEDNNDEGVCDECKVNPPSEDSEWSDDYPESD